MIKSAGCILGYLDADVICQQDCSRDYVKFCLWQLVSLAVSDYYFFCKIIIFKSHDLQNYFCATVVYHLLLVLFGFTRD